MKKYLKYIIPITILVVCYFLFEPVLTHNIGKKKLPNLKSVTVNTSTKFKKVDNVVETSYKELHTPGLSVAIGINNKIVYSNTIGYSNIENTIKVDSLTKFRIGSVSKALTAGTVGKLLQENKLQLNSKVKEYVSYASEQLSKLTLQELASHTSGIRNYSSCLCFPIWEYYNNDEYDTVEESVGIFNNDELLFKPSSDFSYSSYNFTLLSAMIEGAAKESFLDYIQKTVFNPLQLKNTKADKLDEYDASVATFYTIDENTYKESYKVNNSNKWAGGGFISTPRDLVTYGNAMLNHTLIDSITTKTLFTPIKLTNGEVNKQNYALGWRNHIKDNVFSNNRKTNIIHHGGIAMGSTALLVLFPKYNATVAISMNKSSRSFNLFSVAFKLLETYLKEKKSMEEHEELILN